MDEESPPRIVFRLGELARSVSHEEALLLRDWVRVERTVPGVRLAGVLGAALVSAAPEPITLDGELRRALCDALVDEEFDTHEGLARLHDLCDAVLPAPGAEAVVRARLERAARETAGGGAGADPALRARLDAIEETLLVLARLLDDALGGAESAADPA
jgi:hypothetical protein